MAFTLAPIAIASTIFLAMSLYGTQVTQAQLYGPEREVSARCGQFVYWVHGGNFVDTSLLVVGGNELKSGQRGYNFYVCRVQQGGSTFIGKFIKSPVESAETPSQCWVTDGLNEYSYEDQSEYDVLVDYDKGSSILTWETSSIGTAPFRAFYAGRNAEGRTVYVGQCTKSLWAHDSTVIPGAVYGGSTATMNVAFNRQSPSCTPERFLVCNN